MISEIQLVNLCSNHVGIRYVYFSNIFQSINEYLTLYFLKKIFLYLYIKVKYLIIKIEKIIKWIFEMLSAKPWALAPNNLRKCWNLKTTLQIFFSVALFWGRCGLFTFKSQTCLGATPTIDLADFLLKSAYWSACNVVPSLSWQSLI